jgi:hypothetical protein
MSHLNTVSAMHEISRYNMFRVHMHT